MASAGPHVVVAQGFAALREATYRTDAGVSASNGVEFVEATLAISDEWDGSRADVMHGGAGVLPPGPRAGRTVAVRTVHELKGKGSATYTDPLTQWPLYHVCLGAALSGTIGSGDIILSPVRPDLSGSFTGLWYTAEQAWKVLGIRGSMTFRMDAKRRGFAEFNGQGVMADSYPVELAFPSITYTNQAVQPPVFIGGGVSLGALTPVVTGFQVALQNAITDRNDANLAGGHAGYLLTNRVASWAFPAETVLLSAYNPYSTSLSGTTAALAATLGQTDGNKFTFAAAKASINPPESRDESGRLMWGLNGGLHITSGNDEITVTVVG